MIKFFFMSTLTLFCLSSTTKANDFSELELMIRQESAKLIMGYNPQNRYQKLQSKVYQTISCIRDSMISAKLNGHYSQECDELEACMREVVIPDFINQKISEYERKTTKECSIKRKTTKGGRRNWKRCMKGARVYASSLKREYSEEQCRKKLPGYCWGEMEAYKLSSQVCPQKYLQEFSSCDVKSFAPLLETLSFLSPNLESPMRHFDFVPQSTTYYNLGGYDYVMSLFTHSKSNINVKARYFNKFYYIDPHVRCDDRDRGDCIFINGLIQRCHE